MSRAERAVSSCAAKWVDDEDPSQGIQMLSIAASIKARNKRAALMERISRPEVPGRRFMHPGAAKGRRLARIAGVYACLAQRDLPEFAGIVADAANQLAAAA